MRYLPLAAALLLGGCIDFKQITEPVPEPPPPPEIPAEFHASLVFFDALGSEGAGEPSARTGVRIHAVLNPGRAAGGEPRPTGNDTLRVSGTALAPLRVEADGTRIYEGWVPLPEPGEEGMLLGVWPPAVARREGWPPVLWQPVPRRSGGDTLRVAAGEEVRLPFSLPSPPAGAVPLDRSWFLEVGDGQTHVTVSGAGAPPSPLVVPLDLVPPSPGTPVVARLHLNSRSGLGNRVDGGYFIEVVLNASLGWVILRGEGEPQG